MSNNIQNKFQMSREIAYQELKKTPQYQYSAIPQSIIDAKTNEYMKLSQNELQEKINDFYSNKSPFPASKNALANNYEQMRIVMSPDSQKTSEAKQKAEFNKQLREIGVQTNSPIAQNSQIENDAINFLSNMLKDANSTFTQQLNNDNWISNSYNKLIKETLDTEYSKSNVQEALLDTQEDLGAIKASTDLKTTFEERRGVEFNPEKIKETKEKAEAMVKYQASTDMIKTLKRNLSEALVNNTTNNLDRSGEKAILTTLSKLGYTKIGDVIQDSMKGHENDPAVKNYMKEGGKFAVMKDKNGKFGIYRETKEGGFQPITQEMAQIIGKEINKKLNTAYAKTLGFSDNELAGKTSEELEVLTENKYNELKKDYQNTFQEAYGKKDVEALADNYMLSQQKGQAYIQAGVNTLAMVGAMFTGGATAAVSMGVVMTNPIDLIAKATNSDGMSKKDWAEYGTGVLEQAGWMALGMGASKVGETTKTFVKLKGLQTAFKKSGKSYETFINLAKMNKNLPIDVAKSIRKTQMMADALGISAEVATDMATNYLLQKDGATETDWIMSITTTLAGSTKFKQLASKLKGLSTNPKEAISEIKESFSALDLSDADAMKLKTAIEKLETDNNYQNTRYFKVDMNGKEKVVNNEKALIDNIVQNFHTTPKIAKKVAKLIDSKPEIKSKLADLVANNSREVFELENIIKIATPENIDQLSKLIKNKSLNVIATLDGKVDTNDFDIALKIIKAAPEAHRKALLDVASNSNRIHTDIYNISRFMQKYPERAETIAEITTKNPNIKVNYDLNNQLSKNIDKIVELLDTNPDFEKEIIDFIKIQRKDNYDTSDPTYDLTDFVSLLKTFKGTDYFDTVKELGKNPNMIVQFLQTPHDENWTQQEIQDLLALSKKKYSFFTMKRMIKDFKNNPELREIMTSKAPEYKLIDKNPELTPQETLKQRFDIKDKLEKQLPNKLTELKNTLGNDFFYKVQWEKIIPENATPEKIDEIVTDILNKSKFFARTYINQNRYGKNIQWATEINNVSQVATSQIKLGQKFEDLIIDTGLNYGAYDEATTLASNMGAEERRFSSGAYRKKYNDNGAYTPTEAYPEYREKFKNMHNVKRSYKGINLTEIRDMPSSYTKMELYMVHPESYELFKAIPEMEKNYKVLQEFVQQVKSGKPLSNIDKKVIDDNIAEIYYIMANVMPWARGSNGISDIIMRSLYSSLNIDQPALKNGVSLDLEAFSMDFDSYKDKWKTFFIEK